MNKSLVVYTSPSKKVLVRRNKTKSSKTKQNNNKLMQVVQIPRSKSYNMKPNKPKFSQRKDGISVKHIEFLTQVKSPVTGNSNTDLCQFQLMFAAHVNPGNKNLFPWLSLMSFNYESYRFSKLRFIYKPVCNTDTTGTISIAMDYDPDDKLYSNKIQMMSAKSAVSGQPWSIVIHNPNPKDFNKEKTYYISHRDYNMTPSNSLKLLDCGTIQLGVDSAKGNQLLGELYVEYTVDFITPELNVSEVLNGFQGTASQNKVIVANNNSLLGTLTENASMLKRLAGAGLALVKGVGGNKGDLLTQLFKKAQYLSIQMLSTGTTRPVIKHKVLQANEFQINEINQNLNLNIVGSTEIIEELVAGDESNCTDITSANSVVIMDHNVLTTSQVYSFAVKMPAGGFLQIYPEALTYLTDYSLFNLSEISENSYNELVSTFS